MAISGTRQGILARVGLAPGQLVNLVFAQAELKNGLPFAVNAEATDDGSLRAREGRWRVTQGIPRHPISIGHLTSRIKPIYRHY
jgi:antitoxin component of RelBE/YafQ-DinJ toxin-antitoxin module